MRLAWGKLAERRPVWSSSFEIRGKSKPAKATEAPWGGPGLQAGAWGQASPCPASGACSGSWDRTRDRGLRSVPAPAFDPRGGCSALSERAQGEAALRGACGVPAARLCALHLPSHYSSLSMWTGYPSLRMRKLSSEDWAGGPRSRCQLRRPCVSSPTRSPGPLAPKPVPTSCLRPSGRGGAQTRKMGFVA